MKRSPKVACTKAVLRLVCDELAQGKSLKSTCESSDKFPNYKTVLKAVQRKEEFFEMYQNARAIGAEVLADEMFELARKPIEMDDRAIANAEVQRRRVEIDTMKWCFARMQPKGIRNRPEDTAAADNTITLTWGMQQQPEEKTATVLNLVKDDVS
tara:strand:+ start:2650 stop:3114 length:465 start_codon:yes stop_codon:yes gene_type:complete